MGLFPENLTTRHKVQLAVAVAVFALGGYLIYRTFAPEKMPPPPIPEDTIAPPPPPPDPAAPKPKPRKVG